MKIYNRADIVNFLKVSEKYIRMQGFTDGGRSLNASTYDRRYIDEKTERSDVTSYSTEIAYSFDRIIENTVHDLIAEIHDNELVGQTVEILTVNFNEGDANKGYSSKVRTYSVIPDTDGDSTDAYTYSGAFHAAGEYKVGTAKVSSDGLEATFTETTTETE